MQVRIATDSALAISTGALVVPVFSDKRLDGIAAELDAALDGALAGVLAAGEIAGKPGDLALIHALDRPFSRVALMGLGERSKYRPSALRGLAGTAVRALGKRGIASLAIVLPAEASADPRLAASALAEGAIAATLETTLHRSEAPEAPIATAEVALLGAGLDAAALAAGLLRGVTLGEAINHARRMALEPGNKMTPTMLAERARTLGAEAGLTVEVLDETTMRTKGMGALLGVTAGSDEPATLSVMTYRGAPESTEVLALVGKGLTFDSGGISIKPSADMHEMKYDMCGGAGVIAAMFAIGKLKPRLNVIGLVPSSENLPSGSAVKPGDILTAMNGKTIEVINTDAEGRLILADALCYARELGATKLVDAATLTGACVIALGHAASAAVSNSDPFVERFLSVVADVGERYWRMPLYEEYDKQIKSDIADLMNTGGRPAGTLTAAAFLQNFVAGVPWIHLDIAGTAYAEKETAAMAKGPTGTPVRAFVAFVEDLAAHGDPVPTASP